ncbi:MAG: hypothetical protein ACJA13_001285 [Paraglaciecola sp.]|jgi:hypothetical protein
MKFKFLKLIFSVTILSTSCLLNIANATPIISTTYDWSASCYDCGVDDMGSKPKDTDLWTTVTGSITLADYTIGDTFDMEAFVGFTYEGPSKHVVPFNVTNESCMSGTCLANVSGKLFDSNSFYIELTYAQFDAKVAAILMKYTRLIERYRHPRLADIVSEDEADEYAADFCIEYITEVGKYEKCIAESLDRVDIHNARVTRQNDIIVRKYAAYEKKYSSIHAKYFSKFNKGEVVVSFENANGEWSIGDSSSKFDFGISAVITPVNEPGALAIFTLGLMGLSFRRFKKQS